MSGQNMDVSQLSTRQRAMLELLLKERRRGVASQDLKRPSRPPSHLPLSFAQQRLWFMAQLEPDSPFYNLHLALRLKGVLDIGSLERALCEIVRRHEILRTNFGSLDGRPYQVIRPARDFSLPVIDLGEVDEQQLDGLLSQLAADEARRTFDLEHDALLRALLLRLGATEHVMLTTMHHIVSDGLSVGIYIQEAAAIYQAFCEQRPSPLEELPIQYADFACWQRQWLQGEVLEAQLSYWKRHLSKAPEVLSLPTDRPRPAVQGYRGARHEFTLSAELTEALRRLSNLQGVTLFMLLLAAFKVLLRYHARQNDIVVGTPIGGRTRPETERLIGLFTNILVLRTDLSGDPAFLDLLARVRGVALEAYEHQDMPLEKLVEQLQPDRKLSHNPLFQVAFALDNQLPSRVNLPGLAVSRLESLDATAQFDLVLHMVEMKQDLFGSLQYNTELFDPTIARLSNHFEQILRAVVEDPYQRLDQLECLLRDFDRRQRTLEEERLEEASLMRLKKTRRKLITSPQPTFGR